MPLKIIVEKDTYEIGMIRAISWLPSSKILKWEMQIFGHCHLELQLTLYLQVSCFSCLYYSTFII